VADSEGTVARCENHRHGSTPAASLAIATYRPTAREPPAKEGCGAREALPFTGPELANAAYALACRMVATVTA
jgi:hypothetical protein